MSTETVKMHSAVTFADINAMSLPVVVLDAIFYRLPLLLKCRSAENVVICQHFTSTLFVGDLPVLFIILSPDF